jgi:hypothetical protein
VFGALTATFSKIGETPVAAGLTASSGGNHRVNFPNDFGKIWKGRLWAA